MTYCSNCGNALNESDVYCSKCGAYVASSQGPNGSNNNDFTTVFDKIDKIADSGHIGWGLLGFLVPVVGLILFLVWKDEKPKTALMAGKGALINVILGAVFTVLFFILFAVLGFVAM